MSTEAKDTIYIGKKPLMAYVTSTLIQLTSLPAVNIKARGLSIGRAVDVAQIISRKTENAGYSIGNITIGSESPGIKRRQVQKCIHNRDRSKEKHFLDLFT